jgi:hypothetical protein
VVAGTPPLRLRAGADPLPRLPGGDVEEVAAVTVGILYGAEPARPPLWERVEEWARLARVQREVRHDAE